MKSTQLTSRQFLRTAAKAILVILLTVVGASAQSAMELDQQKAARLKSMVGTYVIKGNIGGPGIVQTFQIGENGNVSYSERADKPAKHTTLKETSETGVYVFDVAFQGRSSRIVVKLDGTFQLRFKDAKNKVDEKAPPITTGNKQ